VSSLPYLPVYRHTLIQASPSHRNSAYVALLPVTRDTHAQHTHHVRAPLVVAQRILEHSSLSTTQRYLDHLERADLARWAFSPEWLSF
jgi:integrase